MKHVFFCIGNNSKKLVGTIQILININSYSTLNLRVQKSDSILSIKNNKLDKKHEFMNMKKNNYKKFIDSFLVNPSSMGRTYKDEPYLFDACIAAADFIIGGNH